MSAVPYAVRRAAAISLAAEYDGWGKPPRPEGTPWMWPKRTMPLWQARKFVAPARMPPADRYGYVTVRDDLRMRAYFEAKEKNQNREKFRE